MKEGNGIARDNYFICILLLCCSLSSPLLEELIYELTYTTIILLVLNFLPHSKQKNSIPLSLSPASFISLSLFLLSLSLSLSLSLLFQALSLSLFSFKFTLSLSFSLSPSLPLSLSRSSEALICYPSVDRWHPFVHYCKDIQVFQTICVDLCWSGVNPIK